MCWKLFARPGFTYQCHQEWEINLNQKSSLPLLPLCTVLQGRHPPRRRQPRTEDVCWSVKYWYFQFLHYGWKSCSGAKRIKKLASGVAACACTIANHCDLNRLFIHEGEYEAHWWHEQKLLEMAFVLGKIWYFCLIHGHFGIISLYPECISLYLEYLSPHTSIHCSG